MEDWGQKIGSFDVVGREGMLVKERTCWVADSVWEEERMAQMEYRRQ